MKYTNRGCPGEYVVGLEILNASKRMANTRSVEYAVTG